MCSSLPSLWRASQAITRAPARQDPTMDRSGDVGKIEIRRAHYATALLFARGRPDLGPFQPRRESAVDVFRYRGRLRNLPSSTMRSNSRFVAAMRRTLTRSVLLLPM